MSHKYNNNIYVTVHEKTNHIALAIIFWLRLLLPAATTFDLVLQKIWSLQPEYSWRYQLKYTRIVRKQVFRKTQWNTPSRFTYTRRLWIYVGHTHKGEKASWPLNVQTRAAVNVSNEDKEKSRVFKARYCTKSNEEVYGERFVSSCHTCLIATGPCHD